ncbi:flagellar hook-length control protein FliK, partial [Acidocella facilis]|uniref:flagellar hook-length control protein FliK n=1 Tax=Acidocella facilis TaxID=525 RepID=UPI001F1997FD
KDSALPGTASLPTTSTTAPLPAALAMAAPGGAQANATTTQAVTTTPVTASAGVEATSLAPAALAATVSALHQHGQSQATLRLDPPDLGQLTINLGLSATGQLNVTFIPSTAHAAQALHNGMDGFRQAVGNAGLSLGQADVSSGGQGQQAPAQPQVQRPAQSASAAPAPAPVTTDTGVRAYA